MSSKRVHPFLAMQNYFERFDYPAGHVITLKDSDQSLTTYDLKGALDALMISVNSTITDTNTKIDNTNSSLATFTVTTKDSIADVKTLATTANDKVNEFGVPNTLLEDLGITTMISASAPPSGSGPNSGEAWPRYAFITKKTYDNLADARADVAKKFLYGKQMKLMGVNDWPFQTTAYSDTYWDDADNSCCNHPEGFGYKKKDGYIPDLDTDDVEIFGVASADGTPIPAICWIQY
tara:strand:- start:872 stop:1576 length:705 start_codon:yes stop_codon:yes gene_type:complete